MIAICALAWNKAEMTDRWLDSVQRNSTGHDVGLYLMDNGSTEAAVSEVMRKHKPRYFQRNEKNDSLYKGWNELARRALSDSAEVIILSNNDLLVGPGWLDALTREIRVGDKRYFLPNGDFAHPETFEDEARACFASGTRTTQPARAGWCLVLPADAVWLVVPIPEELQLWYGDDYIHEVLGRAGYRCESVSDACALHLGSVSFFSRPGYTDIVAQDKVIWEQWLKEHS